MELAYNQHAHDLSELHVGNHVAIQNPISKLSDIYGVITAVGPYRRYFVKTQNGRVMIRNRRFLRKRMPTSIFGPGPATVSWGSDNRTFPDMPSTSADSLTHSHSTIQTGPRKSTRNKKPSWILNWRPHMATQLLYFINRGACWGGVRKWLTLKLWTLDTIIVVCSHVIVLDINCHWIKNNKNSGFMQRKCFCFCFSIRRLIISNTFSNSFA